MDCRPFIITSTLALITGMGLLLSFPSQEPGEPLPETLSAVSALPANAIPTAKQITPLSGTAKPARSATQTPLDQHFQAAVLALQNGRYEQALGALHQVLKLAPRLPEAHVNMGFTLLGLGQMQAAADFFSTAIELRPRQLNAYYGLALAQEALNNLPAALGAMRSYIHLTKTDDPRLPKARAALWEWDSQLARSNIVSPMPSAATAPEHN